MGSSKVIATVKVLNRLDCCSDRLTNYQVHVGDNANIFLNDVCPGVYSGSQTIKCDLTGRYVGVTIPGDNQMLTLCEVEAYSSNQLHPVAATQSSTYTASYSAVAFNAIDGRKSPAECNWQPDNSVTSTNSENAWWRADFGKPVTIDYIVTYNRHDCCEERLSNYFVSVGDNPNVFNNPVCPGIWTGAQTIQCNLTGQYVGVFFRHADYLSLCEVEFFGSQ